MQMQMCGGAQRTAAAAQEAVVARSFAHLRVGAQDEEYFM